MSQLILEPVTFQRFIAMGADDLRCILDELETPRARRESGLDESAIESLIRVMDRAGYTSGPGSRNGGRQSVGRTSRR